MAVSCFIGRVTLVHRSRPLMQSVAAVFGPFVENDWKMDTMVVYWMAFSSHGHARAWFQFVDDPSRSHNIACDVTVVCFLFPQIVEAVQACHAHGVVHRDIKDENVLVDMHTGRCYLIDFGSSDEMKTDAYEGYDGECGVILSKMCNDNVMHCLLAFRSTTTQISHLGVDQVLNQCRCCSGD